MKAAVEKWIAASREKMPSGSLKAADLDQLEALLAEPRQLVLYLNSRSSNMRSGISSWVLYDSTQPHEPALLTQEPPYGSVLEAVADGWRIVQFPISKLYSYQAMDNDYLGFEFILEKWV